MDSEIMGTANYKALDLLGDMRRGIWKEASLGSNVTIYRRNLQRAYIERMSYLMKEEIKSGRPSDYYNVAQSDVRGSRRINYFESRIIYC
jgi:hypothetical protein